MSPRTVPQGSCSSSCLFFPTTGGSFGATAARTWPGVLIAAAVMDGAGMRFSADADSVGVRLTVRG